MFLRANMLLHCPEMTRTDDYSIGNISSTKNKTGLEKAILKKLGDLLTGEIQHNRDEIIKDTFEHNSKRAFGVSLISELDNMQSVLGTFLERHKRVKYSTYKNEYHKLAIET